jgi:hypothetical protein
MTYKKYIKRGNKLYGPYYYRSERRDGKIISNYIGKYPSKKVNRSWEYFSFFCIIIILLLTFLCFRFLITGRVSLSLAPYYRQNEIIKGTFSINLREGELLPADTLIIAELVNKTKSFTLEELLKDNKAEGDFYLKNYDISGQGGGYGIIGEKVSYPAVYFELEIEETIPKKFGGAPPVQPEEEPAEEEENVTEETEEDIAKPGKGKGKPEEKDAKEKAGKDKEKGKEKAEKVSVTGKSAGEETEAEELTEQAGVTGAAVKETEEEAENETETGESKEKAGENITEEEGVTGAVVKEAENIIKSEKDKEKPEEKDAKDEKEKEKAEEKAEKAEEVEVNVRRVEGKVTKNKPFRVSLSEYETARLIEGSIKIDEGNLLDSAVNLKIEEDYAIVTTDYEVIERGFGHEYLGKRKKSLQVELEKLNILPEPGAFVVKLQYKDSVILKIKDEIKVKKPNRTTKNVSVPADIIPAKLVLVENIPDQTIKKDGNKSLDLEEYFSSKEEVRAGETTESVGVVGGEEENKTGSVEKAEEPAEQAGVTGAVVEEEGAGEEVVKYSVQEVENITLNIQDSILMIVPDKGFTGTRTTKITASRGKIKAGMFKEKERTESNEFSIIVAETNLSIITMQYGAAVGEPVKWKKHIKLEKPENIIVVLPPKSTNITVKKLPTEQEANAIITGQTSLELQGAREKLAKKISRLFKLTGSSVTENTTRLSEESEEVEVKIIDGADEYEVEYYTEAPQSTEENISETNKIISVAGPDYIHYESIQTYTTIPEVVNLDSVETINLYWYRQIIQNDTIVTVKQPHDFVAHDSDEDGYIDMIQWITPGLSNQTFEVSLEILNVHSYPTLYGNWTVRFNTTGTADLTITATYDPDYTLDVTRWHDESENSDLYDLKFIEVKCGSQVLQYEWIGSNCFENECSVLIANYSCNETGTEISKVLTPKKHVLKFRFGSQEAYAYNDVLKTYLPNCTDCGGWVYQRTTCGGSNLTGDFEDTLTSGDLDTISANDSNYNQTWGGVCQGHKIHFNISESASSVNNITIAFRGNATDNNNASSHDYELRLWNHTNGSWTSVLSQNTGANDGEVSYIILNASDFVNSSGDLYVFVGMESTTGTQVYVDTFYGEAKVDYVDELVPYGSHISP